MTDDQPVSHVEWVPRDQLHANGYNPNRVPPPELDLLRRSLLEDGWTQPVVAREDGEIVDGFHRWTISADEEVAALTGGLIPVVRLVSLDPAHQRMSTIRHNRARGTHHVLKMADIVAELLGEYGCDEAELRIHLGMEEEEVDRLRDRGQMTRRGAAADYGKGWVPGELRQR